MSPKMHNKHAFSPGVLYMYEIMSCFITEVIFEFENP